jgi:hypothetical protein
MAFFSNISRLCHELLRATSDDASFRSGPSQFGFAKRTTRAQERRNNAAKVFENSNPNGKGSGG